MNIRGYGESGYRAPKMWLNLSMPGINKDGQPGAAVLHKIEAGKRGKAGPALLSGGLYRL